MRIGLPIIFKGPSLSDSHRFCVGVIGISSKGPSLIDFGGFYSGVSMQIIPFSMSSSVNQKIRILFV